MSPGPMRHNGVGMVIEALRLAGVDARGQVEGLRGQATRTEANAVEVLRIPCGSAIAAGEAFAAALREEARGMREAAAAIERQAQIDETPAAEVVL